MKYEKDIIIFINKKIYEKLKTCVINARPNESCGLIFGEVKEIKNPEKENDFFYHYYAKHFECIVSSEKSPVSFIMSNFKEIYEVSLKASIKSQYDLISVFHSHPAGTSPSGTDTHYMKVFHNTSLKKFKHNIWTIMDSRHYKLKGFVYLENILTQIDVRLDID